MAPKRLKRVVIKEELVELTGDFKFALILNQFIYWMERRKDFDQYIEEEKKRAKSEGENININKSGGWVYKTMDDLAEELMLDKSKATLSRYVKKLEEMGYLESRTNPEYRWDNTKQYRVNLIKVNKDLLKKGYHLEGYKFDSMYRSIADCLKEKGIISNSKSSEKSSEKNNKNPNGNEMNKNVDSSDVSKFNGRDNKMKHRGFNLQHREIKMKHRNDNMKHRTQESETAIPEITSEITAETTSENKEEEDCARRKKTDVNGEKTGKSGEKSKSLPAAEESSEFDRLNSEDSNRIKEESSLPRVIEEMFHRVFSRYPTDFEREKLMEAEGDKKLLKKALELTGLNSKNRSLSYTITLLRDWSEREIDTPQEVEEILEKHRRRRQDSKNGENERIKKGDETDYREGEDSEEIEEMKEMGWNTGIN